MRYAHASQRRKRSRPSAPEVQKNPLGWSRSGRTRNTGGHLGSINRLVRVRREQSVGGVAEIGDRAVVHHLAVLEHHDRLGQRHRRATYCSTISRRCRLVDLPQRGVSSSMIFGASPSESSSTTRRRGGSTSTRASDSMRCSPPDSVPACCARRSPSRGNIAYARSSPCATSLRPCERARPSVRFSSTVSEPNTERPSGACTIPRRVIFHALRRPMSRSSNSSDPDSTGTRPVTTRAIVDLPAPLAPSCVINDPASTENDTSKIAERPVPGETCAARGAPSRGFSVIDISPR